MRRIVAFFTILFLILSSLQAQSKRVLLDTVHDNNEYATSELRKIFGEDATDTPPFFPINNRMLENYDIFIVTSPRLDYLPSELMSTCVFVQKGGTLLVFSNGSHAPDLNELLSCFGVKLNRDVVEGFQGVKTEGNIQIEDLHFDNPSSLEISGNWDFVIFADENAFSQRIDRTEEKSRNYLKPPGSRPIIAAAKKMGDGLVAVIGEIPNFSYSANKELVEKISCMIPPKKYDARLQTYEEIFDFQKEIEGIYYKRIPLKTSLLLEEAWASYYKNDYEGARNHVLLGKKALREEGIEWRIFIIPIVIFIVFIIIMKFFKIGRTTQKVTLLFGVLTLFSSSLFVSLYYNFSSIVLKVFLLLAVFVLAVGSRDKRFFLQLGIFCTLLSVFYFSGFPASSTLGSYYSPEKLIMPESVPVVLLAQDIANLKSKGSIQDEISFVENLTNARIRYRKEDVNFFPTPVATARHREGNCFRQAIFASSILIRLGYDAYVASGIDHAWVEVGKRGILYPKPPPYLRFNANEISIEYFPSGAFLVLIFLSLIIAYWPPFDKQSVKDIILLGGLSLLFVKIITESAYIPYHLLFITFPLYFLLLRFSSKKRHFTLTSSQQFLLKFAIICVCFFVFILFPLLGTIGNILSPRFMLFIFPLLITIFMAIFAELFVGFSVFPKAMSLKIARFLKLRKK